MGGLTYHYFGGASNYIIITIIIIIIIIAALKWRRGWGGVFKLVFIEFP